MLFRFGGVFRTVWRSALLLGTLVIGTNTLFVAPVFAAPGINEQLNFQGRLLNAQGAIVVDGYYNVQFKIYENGPGDTAGNPGGTLKWTEDWLNSAGHPVKVVNGYMSVQLGSITPFGSSVDWNQDTLWLSINIGNTNVSCTPFASCGGDGEMLPMKRLSAVPYALNSAKLGGLTAAGFIQNTMTVQTATNMAIDGTARADTGILTPYIDTNTPTALNIGTTNATSINLNQNVTVAANKTLTLAGGTTANRPASPTEGMMWYDTTTKQLLVYSNGKWQADRSTSTKIVAASNASQALKDGADYVATGTGDQAVINTALTAAAGGKVYLTEGTYTVNAGIAVPNNTALEGSGNGTIITIPNGLNTSINIVGNADTSTGTGVTIRNLAIDGNRTNQTAGTMYGILLNFSGSLSRKGSMAADNTVYNIRSDGIRSENSYFTTFTGNTVYNVVGYSIITGTGSHHSVLSNNTILSAGSGAGIYLGLGNSNTVTGNAVRGGSYGIILANGSLTQFNSITGNTLYDNTTAAISFNIASNNTVSGNTIYASGNTTNNNAINLTVGTNNTITSNTIFDNSCTTTCYAINIVDNTSSNNYLADNVFSSTPGTSTINDLGTGTVYANQSRAENGGRLTNRTANNTEAFTVQNAAGTNIFTVDTTNSKVLVAGALDTTTATTLSIGTGTATAITLGKVGVTTTVAGALSINPQASTSTTMLCSDAGIVSTCDNSLLLPTATNFIRNQNASAQASSNFWISGTARSDTSVLTPVLDTATAGVLTLGATNATSIALNKNVTVASNMSLTLNGGTTANRPASPTEGMMWYDTSTKQLLVYANGKWQADRNTSTKIVAASNASQALKDSADYVATGTGDQSTINTALTAAAGGKVYLTEGTYTVNASISVPNDTTLAGAGAGTVITIPNSFNANINAITNTTTGGNGTGITIQDLKLDGNSANQTSGVMYGINFSGVGSSTLAGAKITNNWFSGWIAGGGVLLSGSRYSIIYGNTSQASTSGRSIQLANSINNTISDNVMRSGSFGIVLDGGSNHNTLTGNNIQGATAGIYAAGSNSNTITGNTVQASAAYGIHFLANANNNIVSGNKLTDSGGSTANNAIYLATSASSNTITGNDITDTSATTTNYAINIGDSSDTSNYIANNRLSTGTINDLGTGTQYGGQYSNTTTYLIQPATNITMGSASTTTTLQGNTAVTLSGTTGTTMVCQNGSGYLSTCDSSLLAPTATNFIRNQNASAQASANFWISGTARSDTSVLTPTLDAATAGTLNVGTTTATGITLGKAGVATTAAGGLLTSTVDTASAGVLTLGGTTATSVSIGKSAGTTAILSATTTLGTAGSTTTVQGAAQTANNTAGNAMVIQGSSGLGNGGGGNVTLQGGNSGVSGTLGGNLTLAGGTGTTSNGLVLLGTAAFNTSDTDSGCYPGGADSTSTSNCTIAQSSVNNYASVIVGFTNDGQTAFMPSPSIVTAGRVVYVTASATTKEFTLSVNGGGTGNLIAMRKNTTATMIWNGSAWTAAGASSSTTLQAAYDNTLQSAGGAELVVSKTTATNGLTIRDSSVNSVNGALLTVQSSSAANLFSVNSKVTEYTSNSGAETYGANTSTFPANTWSAVNGSTVTRYTTAGNYIATGQGSVSVATSTTAGSGVANRLTTTLTPNMTYNVSFTTRLLSGTFTDMEVYYSINGTATSVACTTGQAVATSIWTKVNCAFAAPASGITANNAILIRQTSSGTARTFYVDNLSVTIAADFNYATDGSVSDGDNFTSNWLFGGLGAGSVTRSTTDGQDASDSAQVTLTTGAANAGIRNKLSLNPLPNTLYRVTVYAKVTSGTFTNFKVRYSRDGSTAAGGNYVDCVDYNTRTLTTTTWTLVTCFIQTDGTTATNPHVYFVEETSAARTFRVDAFTMTLTTNTASNVQIGGGENGGPVTLLTLDKAASAPIAINNDALLGSMYYDTTLGKLQCYEADGWGACGSSPDTIVTISPEFTNAVLHGTGVGTMVSDLCSDTLNINDGSSGQPNICGTNETFNFYKWTSPQPSAQTYGVYVTYQLPASFKSFESGSTSIMGRTDNANSTVEYQVYRNDAATGLIACGPTVLVSTGAAASWQPGVATGTSDPSTCGFAPGNSIVFRINVTASQNANAYIGNLNFIFSNR